MSERITGLVIDRTREGVVVSYFDGNPKQAIVRNSDLTGARVGDRVSLVWDIALGWISAGV